MMELHIDVSGRTEDDIARIQGLLNNPKRLMSGIAAELLSITEENFAQEALHGNKWPSLAETTIEQRKQHGHWPGQMLQISASGLASSVKPFSKSREAGISASKIYAAIHQLGGQAGVGRKVKIKARGYLPMKLSGSDLELTEEARKSLLQMIYDYIDTRA